MKRVLALVFFSIVFLPLESLAQETIISRGEILNLRRSIEIALRAHPDVAAAQNTVGVNKSRVGQAKAGYYPQIELLAGYSRINSGTRQTGSGSSTTFASGTGRTFNQYSGSASLSQNIYDFGRTSTSVKIQNLNVESSQSDLTNTSEQIIFNVKQAYYGVLQAKRNRAVAEETVKQFELHLEQARGFYEVGTKPRFDVTKAEVDLSNARLNLIRAENSLRVSVVTLNNAMGIPAAPEYTLEDNLSFEKFPVTLDAALASAYENRPDLKSLVLQRNAAESSVELAKRDYFPSLTGNASYSKAGEDFPLVEGWSAGVALSFPLFSGFETKYRVEEAEGNLRVLKANEESLRQTIFLEVQQAHLNLLEAEERIATAELTVKQATENYDIATGRYAAGVGDPIEVTDAEVTLANAKTGHIQALYDYKIARASLEKAMGTSLSL